MLDIVTLTCPNCGGKLQVSKDLERFACGYCGNEHIVRRSGGLVSLAPVVDSLVKIETGVDKTASELAIRRLREDVATLNQKINRINKYYSDMSGYGALIFSGGGLLMFSGAFALSSGSLALGLILIIIGPICLITGGRMVINRKIRTSGERKLEQTLKEKKVELKRHENNVTQ